MGKGDRKTAKGKRNISSYGNSRSNSPAKTASKGAAVKTAKPAVKKVQQRLRNQFHHPELKADGVYGPTTKEVVRGFQERRKDAPWKLPVNGTVGKKTWIALFA